jgi:hypothetical protein
VSESKPPPKPRGIFASGMRFGAQGCVGCLTMLVILVAVLFVLVVLFGGGDSGS